MALDTFTIKPGTLTLADLRRLHETAPPVALDPACWPAVAASAEIVSAVIREHRTVYGINTGFGSLARTRIADDQVTELQRRLVLSHAAGVGPLLDDGIVRLMLVLKVNSLALGFSGVRQPVLEAMVKLINAGAYPCVPSKGSVGASGDLAPLAHMTGALMGIGQIRVKGRTMPAVEGLKTAGLTPIDLAAKEGLALLNGTQTSTALGLAGLFAAENVFAAALAAGAMSVDAAAGSDAPFDPRIHKVRGQVGQIEVAKTLLELMEDSEIRRSHIDCDRVQDPYSLRCQPQVMGAALDLLRHSAGVLTREANAVSDNPLVFAKEGEVISGGNFHAEPVAMAADVIAIALAEIGALSERRIAMLTDAKFSALPAFLVPEPGLNSGFMLAHVTAAALASENKSLAHPASVDSLPTSANQEDHVSMATYAARRLGEMAENSGAIAAIELLAAAQGIDLRRPLKTSPRLQKIHGAIRGRAAFWDQDREMAPDIAAVADLVRSGDIRRMMPLPSLA
jgi:histidine ammonia-lyase